MLVARESFDNYHLPLQHSPRQRQVQRVRRVSNKTKFFYCAVVLIAMSLAFLLTSKYAQIASVGYDIVALKKQVQDLDTENQMLENNVSELKSLKNIEYVATTRLGMKKPELAEGVQFVPVEYSKAGLKDSPMGVAVRTDSSQSPKASGSKNFLAQALAKIIDAQRGL